MAKKGGNIVIIGGGASGMTAAIRAKQRGAEQVILLEASSELGGNAVYAPVPLLNPEQFTEDAIEKEYLEMMQFTDWTFDPRIVRTLLENSARIPAWLEESGADLKEGEKDGKLAAFLIAKCYELGVDVRLNCYAKKILKDANDWCSGVWVEQDGKHEEIEATVVVLATGGFLGENRLMEQFCPYYDEVFFDEVGHTGKLYSGNGVEMAIRAGAGDEGISTFVARWLRRQNGLIWYYLVHDNLFVSGLDWGTIIYDAPRSSEMLPFYRKWCTISGTLSTFCGQLIKADTHIYLLFSP